MACLMRLLKSRAKGARLWLDCASRSREATIRKLSDWRESFVGSTMNKKVIELVRVSTEGQAAADRAGIPAQRAANQRTAAQYGLQIINTIEITDVSGTAVLRSPEMQKLLRLIESPDIHGVVAKEFSRLMRPENFADYDLLQHFIDTNTVLYLPDGPLDFASEAGKLLGGIRALIAGQERREMLRRLHDAKEAIRRAGKNAGGASVLPYGIGYSKDRGWHHTPEIGKVKRAFEMFLGGETSYQRIGRELNVPRQNVRYVMENRVYTGWRVYDQRRDPSAEAYVPNQMVVRVIAGRYRALPIRSSASTFSSPLSARLTLLGCRRSSRRSVGGIGALGKKHPTVTLITVF